MPTGIAIAIPDGYAGFVQPRSGLALRHGVTCLNTPGLIDAGYRDEISVLLVNLDPETAFAVIAAIASPNSSSNGCRTSSGGKSASSTTRRAERVAGDRRAGAEGHLLGSPHARS